MSGAALQPPSVMDPRGLSLAQVYAEALLGLIGDDARAEAIHEALARVVRMLDEIDRAHALLTSEQIDDDQREAMVHRIFGGRVDEVLEDFLAILARHGRVGLITAIERAYRKLLNRRQGRLEVTVVTAAPLADDQKAEVVEQLSQTLEARLAVTTRVDADLLGGMVLQIGDRVYDASVAGQLQRLQQRLTGRRWLRPPSDRDESDRESRNP